MSVINGDARQMDMARFERYRIIVAVGLMLTGFGKVGKVFYYQRWWVAAVVGQ